MKIRIAINFIFVLLFLSLINFADAQSEVVDAGNLKIIMIPIHVIELVLALFIAYMSLKFFRITKPISLFLYMYLSIGFFIINALLYLFLYLSLNTKLEMSFVNVYVGSRVALVGMMVSLVVFFYRWNRAMRKT